MSSTSLIWILWIAATLMAGALFYTRLFVSGPQTAFLMGETTAAHHQIELACNTCHTAPFFASEVKADKAMNKACLSCHRHELEISNDSHPVKKFRGPEKIKIRENLDALYCSTCHLEHRPEVTGPVMVTLPTDFCVACHEEVGRDRASHNGLEFETCASAGCHNFHDNTALYEKFLVNHGKAPDFADHPVSEFAAISRSPSPVEMVLTNASPKNALEAYLSGLEERPEDPDTQAEETLAQVLYAADALAPKAHMDTGAIDNWAASAHSLAGINCAGCHAPEVADTDDLEQIDAAWIEAPDTSVCSDCHNNQAKSFSFGKHGMTAHPELKKPRKSPTDGIETYLARLSDEPQITPLQVGASQLPTQLNAHDRRLGSCANCHAPHGQDMVVAAVEACTSCHADEHTQNYEGSPHHALWLAELAGEGEPGSGVSCADCHMPKLKDRRAGFVTTHNQNAYLRPNEKIIRPVCMSCHSVAFSIDALADRKLVESNFNGRPEAHIESVDWALRRVKEAE